LRAASVKVKTLTAHQKCQLKNHYRGALREVAGYLDLLASRDPERFVFAKPDNIVDHCRRFEQPSNKYGKRWVERALAELRARHVITRAIRVRGYQEKLGWIVAHHDALARRVEPGACVWFGTQENTGDLTTVSPPVNSSVSLQAEATMQKPGEKPVEKPDGKPVHRPVEKPVTTQLFHDDSKRVDQQNAGRTVVVNQTVGTERDELVKECSRQEIEVMQSGSNGIRSGYDSRSQGLNEKAKADAAPADPWAKWTQPGTIGAQFRLPFWSDLTTVAEGLVTDTKAWSEFNGAHDLENLLRDVLLEFYDKPYCGPTTHAELMGEAMKRFNSKHGTKVPKAWVKLMNDYRRSARETLTAGR
jgi:hypothetical protein